MFILFEGTISCKAILESKHRNCLCLYVDKKKRNKDFRYIIRLAKRRNCPVRYCFREELNDTCGHNKHGGMLLKAESKTFPAFTNGSGFMAYIDGVEDPYNLGSICRTLYASGCRALILPKRDWSNAENTIMKASAGAFEKLTIMQIDSDETLISILSIHHIPLFCAYRNHAKSLYEMTFPDTFCLAIGGALRGLSADLIAASRQNIYIPYGSGFKNALDTASATAVMSFEILRQKM